MLTESETRAEIARRRLAELAASFDAQIPPDPGGRHVAESSSRRRVGLWHVRFVIVMAIAAGVVGAWWLLASRPDSGPGGVAFASAPGATPAARVLVVDVAGAVRHPGIVELPPGSRVHDAIDAAGGLVPGTAAAGLNMARLLVDGEQVLVGLPPVAMGAGAASGPLSLNSATVDQLDELPGIGPVTAAAIVQWRTDNGGFRSVDDLLDVSGIGEATLDKIRDLVSV